MATPLESRKIDPDAESSGELLSSVSAKQEVNFFDRGKAEHDLAQNRMNLGLLGKFFGANSQAPTNIAGFICCLSMLIFIGTFFCAHSPEISDVRKILIGLVGSTLAFIFGAATKK